MDWTQFDGMIDAKTMDELDKLASGTATYEKVPFGKYEVVPEKIELTTSKNGNPMMVAWLRIVAGPHAKSIVFANFVMKSSFGIHKAKEFIRSMDPSTPATFTSFTQWDIYLKGVSEEICCQCSYVLDYSEEVTKKGDKFDKYTIEEGPFEVPADYEPPKTKSAGEGGDWVQIVK